MSHIKLIYTALLLCILSGCIGTTKKISSSETHNAITLSCNNTDLITYHKTIVEAPVGKDSLYNRNGFIHPLKTLKGVTLTQIHPEKHEHHLGLWHPWTKTHYKSKAVDFWNLDKGEGYVKHIKTLAHSGGEFSVLLQHALKATNEIILTDTFSVKLTQKSDNYYLLDYRSIQTCVADSPITMLQYRYGGGLGLRLPKSWAKSNVEVLTSEGTSRHNTDATSAYWLKLRGADSLEHNAGLVIIPHKSNFSYPEQIRLWDEKMYPGGDFMVNISPTKKKPLTMYPQKSYEFNYRLIIFDGDISKVLIEEEYKRYNAKK